MTIKILEQGVVSQIAAGEVVERPASVVKELVENALDAGSSQVSVEVRGGGTSLIRVTDNGIGIPEAEVELAFERHATSKINKLDDLQTIGTLGFRGEALPSIATVADVEIVTCAAGEPAGTYLKLENGVTVSRGNEGRARGTTVTVRDLFRKVPARLKFLKSASTENSHIANVVSQYALAFPEVGFTLITDGKEVLGTPGRGRLLDSVIDVYGLEIARNMLEIGNSDGEWKDRTVLSRVTGLVGSPSLGRSGRGYLSFFVNRRWVTSRLLSWAVEEAYHGLLMTGKHPVAIINVALPPHEVDVNIHPAKSEVKFLNEHAVFAAVQKAVRRALMERMPVPQVEEVAAPYAAPGAEGTAELWTAVVDRSHKAFLPEGATQPMLAALPALRVLGQLLSSYIIAEGPDGLYLIDQHAAHERVLFEKIMQQKSRQEIEVQGLLEAVTFEVSPRQREILRSHSADLAVFGFSLEPFGDKTYLVRTVPRLLDNRDWAGTLRELLDSLAGEDRGSWEEKMAISIACHSAVRSGQVLAPDEMRELVRQLERVVNPHCCPHGRPTMIHLSTGRLEKEFGRS